MEHIVDRDVIIRKLQTIFNEAQNGRVIINSTDNIPFAFNVGFQVESNDPNLQTVQEN